MINPTIAKLFEKILKEKMGGKEKKEIPVVTAMISSNKDGGEVQTLTGKAALTLMIKQKDDGNIATDLSFVGTADPRDLIALIESLDAAKEMFIEKLVKNSIGAMIIGSGCDCGCDKE